MLGLQIPTLTMKQVSETLERAKRERQERKLAVADDTEGIEID